MVVAERKDFSILTNSSREINESIALTPFYTPFSEGGLNYLRQIKIIRLFSTLCDNFCLWSREMLIGQDF